jgi:predicted GNAT family acetyltransferase
MSQHIEHHKDKHQFTTQVDGKVATLNYFVSSDGKTLEYYSTFVPPELRGRHIGQDIVKFALDFAKEHDYKVDPTCPFVSQYIERHPKYKEILV